MVIYGIEHLQDIQPDPVEPIRRWALPELMRDWLAAIKKNMFFQGVRPGVNIYPDFDD